MAGIDWRGSAYLYHDYICTAHMICSRVHVTIRVHDL